MTGIFVLGGAALAVVCAGMYFNKKQVSGNVARKVLLGAMLFIFASICLSAVPVFAAESSSAQASTASGAGLGYLGASLATGLACVGAGIAVGYVGAAALGIVGEKPQMLGTTLIYLGLAEGIAIYGVIVSLLILGRV